MIIGEGGVGLWRVMGTTPLRFLDNKPRPFFPSFCPTLEFVLHCRNVKPWLLKSNPTKTVSTLELTECYENITELTEWNINITECSDNTGRYYTYISRYVRPWVFSMALPIIPTTSDYTQHSVQPASLIRHTLFQDITCTWTYLGISNY